MSEDHYREALQKLHVELGQASSDHPPAQKAIGSLSQNVRSILEHPGEVAGVHHHNLLSDLRDALGLFEVRHPALYSAVSSVINTLSNMGI